MFSEFIMANEISFKTGLIDKLPGQALSDVKSAYRIGNLAREFDVSLRTLRFYEDKGLLTPKRVGTTRLYSIYDRNRLKLILFSKQIGFSLMEIREILMDYDANQHLKNPMASSRERFQEKLVTLKTQRADIDDSIQELSQQLNTDNGIFSE
jgi:DNA-binding transcriptional MerR regulator